MKKQLSLGLAAIAVIMAAATTALSIGTTLMAYAQSTTGDVGQVKRLVKSSHPSIR